ncbi:hypothetical protein [Streptomyces sp. NPDC048521]|uniref:hypothetical protein n=1 Tax=Streptomyces sp. NPDC048521 TaxID=3365566 RepID=UPI003717BC53
MPRGRHRHSPPLHRLLPPSAIAGVSVVCALGPWVFSEATVLRVLAAAAAATAVAGAVVMRRWDTQAGKQVADLMRARAGDEWRYEERVAELETDLEESRELRVKLEQRLRAKRAELAGLRNEHAALLRRYATAETERASALEGRRLLEIEAAAPSSSPALPPARSAEREAIEAAPGAAGGSDGSGRSGGSENPDGAENSRGSEAADASQVADGPEDSGASEDASKAHAVFSPEGSRLYRRALTALARFDRDASAPTTGTSEVEAPEPEGAKREAAEAGPVAKGEARKGAANGVTDEAGASRESGPSRDEAGVSRDAAASAAEEAEEQGQPAAADGHAHAAAATTVATTTTAPAAPAKPVAQPPAGHFTVPTAVAVVPAAPVRRPVVEGGFDFFGTQKDAPKAALDSVQNEDLADVVGQEALAVHKAESEAQFKSADARSRGVGQVIDLTAHDETEQIDLQGLRSAAS